MKLTLAMALEAAPLEAKVAEMFAKLQVPKGTRDDIMAYVAPLRRRSAAHFDHYLHNLRVGLLTERIGEFLHMDARACFFAGVLHDNGKLVIPAAYLARTAVLNKREKRFIRRHVMAGYNRIVKRFPFTARVILWHHRFQANPYPLRLPRFPVQWSAETDLSVQAYGRVLALADGYDASFRPYNAFSADEPKWLQAKRRMLAWYPKDWHKLIESLYAADIFHEYDAEAEP